MTISNNGFRGNLSDLLMVKMIIAKRDNKTLCRCRSSPTDGAGNATFTGCCRRRYVDVCGRYIVCFVRF